MNDKVHLIGGKAYKEARVVMLATNDSSVIQMHIEDGGFQPIADYRTPYRNPPRVFQNYHIYIVSNEEVKQDDWYYSGGMTSEYNIHKADSDRLVKLIKESKVVEYPKIIASTDTILNLPRPSYDFIRKYCDFRGIDKVLVEVTEFIGYITKVSSDNTITIRPIEKLTFKDKFDQFIDERIKLASGSSSEEAYQIVKQFVKEHWEQRNNG